MAKLHFCSSHFELAADLVLPGEGVSAFFGPSGAGKTTMLRALAGLDYHPNTRVTINGQCWQDASMCLPVHKRSLAYVFQEPSLFTHLNVKQNLEYAMTRAKHKKKKNSFDEVVELLDLDKLLKSHVGQLSGGEAQRVAIARALLSQPELLLMDEPLASLDEHRKAVILRYLEKLVEELKQPLIYVSHSLNEIAQLSDYLVLIHAGRIIRHGPLTEVLSSPELCRLEDHVCTVIDAKIAEHNSVWCMQKIIFPSGEIWLTETEKKVGDAIRVQVNASDVSIALSKAEDSSITNILSAKIHSIDRDNKRAQTLVRLIVGDTILLARVMQHSVDKLGLAVGMRVWAQIKSVAILR